MDDLVRDRLTLAVEDALEAGHDAHAIVDALLDGIRLGIGGNAPPEPLGDDLSAINPENLLRLPREQFAALFAAQFPDLVKRNAEIVAGGKERQAAHGHGKKPIADEADSLDVTQWLRVADDHLKEVGEAAERVTQPLFQAHRAAVGWFKGLREDVEALRGVGKNPALGTLQQMQTAFLIAKARAERERQLQAQRDAEDRAAAALKEANERQAAEVALAPAQITEDVLAATDEAIAAAQAASAEAADAARSASAPVATLGRTRDALGTQWLQQTWSYQVTNKALLCLSIGAPALINADLQTRVAAACQIGPAAVNAVLGALAGCLMPEGIAIPDDFVSLEDGRITRAISRKQSPMRSIPGLEIIEGAAARRRGT